MNALAKSFLDQDPDPRETREWIESIEAVIGAEGTDRAHQILEKLVEHTSNIDLDETKHGPRGNRNLDFEPSFIIRGLSELHVKLTPKA